MGDALAVDRHGLAGIFLDDRIDRIFLGLLGMKPTRNPDGLKSLTVASMGLSVSQRKAIGVTAYVPRVRAENEALPPQIDKMAGKYTPPVWHTRSRADDHLQIASRGIGA